MISQQEKLPFEFDLPSGSRLDTSDGDRFERALGAVSAGLAALAKNMPRARRPLSDSSKALHVRVVCEKRGGWCPSCQSCRVCENGERLPGAEFDHFYGRHRNAPDETWLVCGSCNRDLELPRFKASVRSAFDAYRAAVLVVMVDAQRDLF